MHTAGSSLPASPARRRTSVHAAGCRDFWPCTLLLLAGSLLRTITRRVDALYTRRHRHHGCCCNWQNPQLRSHRMNCTYSAGVKKGSPYSTTERKVPELIPVLGSQPAGDVSHEPGSRLPLLSCSYPRNP